MNPESISAESMGSATEVGDSSATVSSERYHALDSLRAAAMLLGVLYHAVLFGSMGRGFSRGGGLPGAMELGDWLHSFRMPLFFMISGFFCRMMHQKYGLKEYLRRRWIRIGLPLIVCLFTLVPLDQGLRAVFGGPGGGPPPGMGGRPGGPPGFRGGPPFNFTKGFDARKGASKKGLPPREKKGEDAVKSGEGDMPVDFPFDFPPPEGMPFPPPGMPFPPGGPMPFGNTGNTIGEKLFGPLSQILKLEYLWFLWYLLVFATIGPLLSWVASKLPKFGRESAEHPALRFNFAPLLVGIVATPCLMQTTGFGGWSLGLASGIFRPFPDFLIEFQPDMPFYGVFFITGWWLQSVRSALPTIGKNWWIATIIGVITYVGSAVFSTRYASQTALPDYEKLKVIGYGLSSITCAYTSFGLVGLFQRYLNKPTARGKYLSDCALWIYLAHLPIIEPVLALFRLLGLPWLIQALLVTTVTTGIAIGLFEKLIRPVPRLLKIFGPGSLSKPATFESKNAPAMSAEAVQ